VVAAGHGVQGLALGGKDFGVDGEQLSALHARATGARTDQQRVVHVFERGHGVAMGFHAHQQGECAVLQLHHHALQGLLGLLEGDFEQAQDDGLVFAQHFARGDAEQNCVTDLTCCAGNGNADGLLAHRKTPGSVVKAWTARAGRKADGCAEWLRVYPCLKAKVNLSYVLYKI